MAIRSQPDRRAQIRRDDFQRVKRRLLDRRHARVGRMAGIAEVTLIDGGPAPELGVEPCARLNVIVFECGRQRRFLDTDRIASASMLRASINSPLRTYGAEMQVNGWIQPSP